MYIGLFMSGGSTSCKRVSDDRWQHQYLPLQQLKEIRLNVHKQSTRYTYKSDMGRKPIWGKNIVVENQMNISLKSSVFHVHASKCCHLVIDYEVHGKIFQIHKTESIVFLRSTDCVKEVLIQITYPYWWFTPLVPWYDFQLLR